MYENPEKTCTKFIIPTDSKLLYQFTIKIDGYDEPEFPKAPDPDPTVVVKPNITNVVRPVVKVVVTPPAASESETVIPESEKEFEPEAIIETIVEEPEIEIEAEEEQLPEVEAIVEEEELEVYDLLASIPEAEEEDTNTVDAIDVFWKERQGKTYRYDPDGNDVEEGDIVLVPTRDISSDKEVVREAEVARGNYKVDPMTLDHPLKKIIGVVKRRAEMVFTAMITPNDDEDNQN